MFPLDGGSISSEGSTFSRYSRTLRASRTPSSTPLRTTGRRKATPGDATLKRLGLSGSKGCHGVALGACAGGGPVPMVCAAPRSCGGEGGCLRWSTALSWLSSLWMTSATCSGALARCLTSGPSSSRTSTSCSESHCLGSSSSPSPSQFISPSLSLHSFSSAASSASSASSSGLSWWHLRLASSATPLCSRALSNGSAFGASVSRGAVHVRLAKPPWRSCFGGGGSAAHAARNAVGAAFTGT
mmetsp:Transcript_6619/g.16394  ORF Transcript_6619/g.16394 Transcript_6619/m.16394 type:complete len:242 (-) Transcript_6619:497-1222(-)